MRRPAVAMLRQATRWERSKQASNRGDAHPRQNSGPRPAVRPVRGDDGGGHLQLDGQRRLLSAPAFAQPSPRAGLVVVQSHHETDFLQNLVYYVATGLTGVADYGIWRRVNKGNHGERERKRQLDRPGSRRPWRPSMGRPNLYWPPQATAVLSAHPQPPVMRPAPRPPGPGCRGKSAKQGEWTVLPIVIGSTPPGVGRSPCLGRRTRDKIPRSSGGPGRLQTAFRRDGHQRWWKTTIASHSEREQHGSSKQNQCEWSRCFRL